jgi:serine/threonine protein kinase
MMQGNEDDQANHFFERVEGWWFQDSGVPEFAENEAVFPRLQEDLEEGGRTRKPPSRFLGSKWLLALKPVYDMDLKRFTQASPTLYPVGDKSSSSADNNPPVVVVAGIPLTQESALQLARDVCYAGRIMHSVGLIHRDIKPKNIMLSQGRPVIIDFGFSHFVNNKDTDGRFCIVQEGRVKGEARYVLAPDVAMSRGCQEGDMYAMGKTLYEVLFCVAAGSAPSGKVALTESEATEQTAKFRAVLDGKEAGSRSRFHMSTDARDTLLTVIRGLCRQDRPISFEEAEKLLRT